MNYKHLFGPVHSRRLGISLGVDMVQFKTCTLNCAYCECGETTTLTIDRQEYVRADEIIAELTDFFSISPQLDFVTFAGSGEPTLNTALESVIAFVKDTRPQYKTALLTNGTLFSRAEMREEVMRCDLILPSLDAISEEAFGCVNKPDPRINNAQVIEGLVELSRAYKGALWLEIFIVPGLNDSPEELLKLKEAALRIKPTRVQLNSLDRPGACDWVQPVAPGRLEEIADFMLPLPIEIISRNRKPGNASRIHSANQETLPDLLRRRPSTIEEIAIFCGSTINDTAQYLEEQILRGAALRQVISGTIFYRLP